MDTKLQAELSVDTSQGEASIDRFGKSVTRMSDSVSRDAARAGKAVDSIGNGAEKSASNFNRAERSMADAIKRTTERMELLGKTASQKFEFKLESKGLDAAKFEPALARLREIEVAAQRAQQAASGSLNSMGASAAQTAAALRNVPAQFTDIVVSLQSGQQPLTVLLQQGGQLKDMFGGAGAAARALGGYVAGLANPFTVTAAAAGVLFLAYEQGRKESAMLEQSLLKTGNIIGATTGQLNQMAQALDSQGFTQGAAAAALAQIATTGAVATRDLQEFTRVAMDLERLVGTPVEETAKAFKELGNEPAKAVLKLNESLHFLTLAQYEQIKSLEEQGRKTDAARIAQQTYSDALKPMLENARQNIGYLERSWLGVTTAAKEAWDAMLNVGRKETGEDRLTAARARLKEVENTSSLRMTDEVRAIRVKQIQTEITYLERVIQATKDGAAAVAERQRVEEAGIKASGEVEKTQSKGLTRQQQLNKALEDYRDNIAKIRAANPASALVTDAAVARGEQAIREQYKATAAVRLTSEQTQIAAIRAKIAAEDEAISRLTQYGAAAAKQTDGEREVLKLQEQIALATDKKTKAELQAQLAAAKTLADRQKTRQVLEEEIKRQEEATGLQAKFAADLDKSTEAIIAQAAGQERANEVYGRSKAAVAELVLEEMKQNLELERNQAQMPGVIEKLEARIAAQTRLVDAMRTGEVKQAAEKSADDAAKEWKRTAEKIEQSLTDALMRGFESGKGFAETLRDTVVNMFKTMVLRPVIQAIVAPVMGAFGMPASAGQGGIPGSSFGPMDAYSAFKMSTASEWFTNFGGSLSDAAYNAGGSLYRAGFESMGDSAFEAGKFLSDFSKEINMAGDALGYLNAAAMASEGRWGAAIGSAAGTYFGGPIGSFIGSTIGSAIDKVFAGDSGTMHRGGAYSIDTAGNGYTANNSNTAGFGLGWDAFRGDRSAGVDGALKVFSTGLAATMQSALKNFGVAENYRISAKFASDNNDGSVGGLRIANSAGDVISSFDRNNFASDPEKGFTEFSAAVAASIRDALVAADIPGWAQSALKAIGDTPSLDQLSAAVANINSVSAALLSMADVMPQLAGLSDDATTGLLSVFGGIENLKAATAGYYQNFYTETERTATATRQVSEAMADIGLAMPETRDGFRALVEAQDLTTEAGRSTYAALMQLQGAFVGVADAAAASAQQLEQQMVDGLQASFDAFTSLASTSAGYGDTSGLTDYLVGLQNSFDFAGSIGAQKSVLDAMAGAEAAIADARQSSAQAELQAISARKTALQDELTSAQALLGAAQGLRKYVQDLRASAASPLSDAEKLNVLAARYSMQVSLARAGDVDSLSSVQGTASAYLDVLKAQSRTSEDYALAFAKVAGELDTLGSTTETAADQQVRLLQDQMDAIDRQTAAMESIQGVSRATKDLTESLLSKAREQLVQGLQSASAQLIATDSISENLKKLPPELASVLSSVIASSLSPMIASLASAVGSSISSAQVAQAAQQAATGSVTVADVYETVGASTKSAGLAYATSPGGIGQDAYYKAIRDNVAAVDLSSKAAIYGLKSAADQWGVSAYDISKATGYSYKDVLDTFQKAGIPAFAVGTNYVPRDTLAVVHEGEAIIPRAYNPAAGGLNGGNTERLERLVEILTAEVQRLQSVAREGNYEARRAADAVNGRPEQPMIVEIA